MSDIDSRHGLMPDSSSTPEHLVEGHVSDRPLVELLASIDRRLSTMEDVLAGLAADEAELATIVPKLVARDEEISRKLGEFEAKAAAGELVPREEVEKLKSGFDQSVASLKALIPAEPVPVTEDVTVTVGETGEGTVTVQHAPAAVTVTTQPSSGTASVEAIEGQPAEATIRVVNATPSTSQVVGISIAPATGE